MKLAVFLLSFVACILLVTVHSKEVEQFNSNNQEFALKENDALSNAEELDSRHRMLDEVFSDGRRGRRGRRRRRERRRDRL
jgi:hypothetical protein